MGAVGVTGTGAANALASQADVIVGVGTRFADFTTGSWALFKNPDRRLISVNVQPFDAAKHQRFVCRRRRADGACRARFQARRLEGAARLERRSRQGQGRMGDDRRPLHRADQRAGADRRRSARRAHARGREVGRRRLRLWRTAGRIAQAVAGRRSARLPSRIRLFLHGLRDRRRDRRQDGSAGPGSCWWCSATARIS